MAEVIINGQNYLIGKLNARQQFHIARRLAPFVRQLMPLFAAIQQAQQSDVVMNPPLEIQIFAALGDTISAMSDTDADYVIDHCLAAIRFRSGMGNWAPLAPNGGSRMQLEAADDLAVQIRLVWEVLYSNLSSFSFETALPLTLTAPGNGQAMSEQLA